MGNQFEGTAVPDSARFKTGGEVAALLYLDLLGVRSRWHKGGKDGVKKFVEKFRVLVRDAIVDAKGEKLRGGLEADSLAIVCPTVEVALDISRKVYRTAFLAATKQSEDRLWIRGVVTQCDINASLRTVATMKSLADVKDYQYGDALLDAIAVERSGVKGMRILIDNAFVNDKLRAAYRISIGQRFLIPFKKLHNSAYPPRVGKGYQDYLWMASSDKDSDDLSVRMEQRLRWSSNEAEEFIQAAATMVLFGECRAIRYSIENRRIRTM
jgi:hypothetical protein